MWWCRNNAIQSWDYPNLALEIWRHVEKDILGSSPLLIDIEAACASRVCAMHAAIKIRLDHRICGKNLLEKAKNHGV